MAGAASNLVPITREFMAKFYEKYPLDPLPGELETLRERLISLTDTLDAERKKMEGQKEDLLAELVVGDIPHKLDQNFWKNREMLEEIVFLCDAKNLPASLKAESLTPAQQEVAEAMKKWGVESQRLLDFIAEYQKRTSARISDMVFTYMPQDFRGTLFKQMKDRSEKRREVEVATLVTSGGTIKQKYALLWQQQMDRRTSLASLGSATGMYRAVVTYLAGVPQVLLDFVKTINDHNGPMEEQRLRYGPHLYHLTTFINRLHTFLSIWWITLDTSAVSTSEAVGLVDDSLRVYATELVKFVDKIQETFENAPFLISADEAMTEEGKSKAAEDFKEEIITFGASLTVPVTVEVEGTVIAWDFKLTSGKDVGFSVEYLPESGQKTGVYPYTKVEAHQGSFNAPGVGSYNLVFDNTYSYITRKVVRYKVGAIPPIETAEQVAAEEALTHPEGTQPASE